jgi:hypothetical protein
MATVIAVSILKDSTFAFCDEVIFEHEEKMTIFLKVIKYKLNHGMCGNNHNETSQARGWKSEKFSVLKRKATLL